MSVLNPFRSKLNWWEKNKSFKNLLTFLSVFSVKNFSSDSMPFRIIETVCSDSSVSEMNHEILIYIGNLTKFSTTQNKLFAIRKINQLELQIRFLFIARLGIAAIASGGLVHGSLLAMDAVDRM